MSVEGGSRRRHEHGSGEGSALGWLGLMAGRHAGALTRLPSPWAQCLRVVEEHSDWMLRAVLEGGSANKCRRQYPCHRQYPLCCRYLCRTSKECQKFVELPGAAAGVYATSARPAACPQLHRAVPLLLKEAGAALSKR